ncbi:MAG: translation elongation factor Ts [Patescibacteria group bacterium]|nr:translation elongation factor Ts [Patescibacteria group bacterium]MCL5094191.1 translation elongation factor Ts [Patescibacteria group bacterium]
MAVKAKDVSKLREETGVGMMDCKKALEEAGGDFNKAVEILRKKGAKTAEKRAEREAKEGYIASYNHNGRIAVLLELNSETDFVARNDDFRKLANEIAMQVAAMNPKYLSSTDIPAEVLENEKKIEKEKLEKEGKPKEIIEKVIEGRIQKFFEEICLLNQPYIKDEKKKVEDLLNEARAKIGEKIEIGRFVRFEIGKETILGG